MKAISEVIKEKIHTAVKNLYGVALTEVHLEHPENETWGDYATNVALGLAKSVKQSPMEVAKKLCYELESFDNTFVFSDVKYPLFQKIEMAAPGFINFKLSSAWLQNVLYDISADPTSYGSQDMGEGKRIALEHSNVNPNKAAHVGHLRNACIGQFVEKIYEFLGYQAEVQYYNNDLGVQAVTSYMGTKFFTDVDPSNYDKYDHYAWDVYTKMESLANSDPKIKEDREKLLIDVESRRTQEWQKLKVFASRILLEQLKTFQQLGMDYDVVINESDIVGLQLWQKAFELLKKNPNVYYATSGKSAGCWLIKLNPDKSVQADEDVEVDKILVRSNGVPTYTARDIAYHMWKFGLLGTDFGYEKWETGTQSKPLWVTISDFAAESGAGTHQDITFSYADIVFDVIDVRQTYAINAVKKSLEYLGYDKQSQNMTHINYGFVYLSKSTAQMLGIDVSDGKPFYAMSGRKGWGIKVDDFISKVDEKIAFDHGKSEGLSRVRNAAVKFELLKSNTFQDLVFDLESALNIKGYTGPYLLYTYARCASIMEKSGYEFDMNRELYNFDAYASQGLAEKETELLRWIYRYPEVVKSAALDFAPNQLCNYLYVLAQRFNSLYAQLPIINNYHDGEKSIRLLLTGSVMSVLRSGLSLLGIETVEKM